MLPHASKGSQQISYNVLELPPHLEPCTVLQSVKTMATDSLLPSRAHATLKPCKILEDKSCLAELTYYKVTTLPHRSRSQVG